MALLHDVDNKNSKEHFDIISLRARPLCNVDIEVNDHTYTIRAQVGGTAYCVESTNQKNYGMGFGYSATHSFMLKDIDYKRLVISHNGKIIYTHLLQ
jgi:hypothetical protein